LRIDEHFAYQEKCIVEQAEILDAEYAIQNTKLPCEYVWTGDEEEDLRFQMLAENGDNGIPYEVAPLRLYDNLTVKLLKYDKDHKDERIVKYSKMVDNYKE
jgi:hypothetical protein